MRTIGGAAAVVIAVVLIIAYSSVFVVHQTQQALVLRFGEPIRQPITTAGLYYKYPFIDSVVLIDKRILDLDSPAQEVGASGQSGQSRIVVDAFARYRIFDPLKFYQAAGSIEIANSRLSAVLNSSIREVIGRATLLEVVRDERTDLMLRISERMNMEAKTNFGIEIIDVRLRRADLPKTISQAVFLRMQTERQREAAEIRGQGAQASQAIRAKADRDVTVIIAEATSKGEQYRGEGDGTRNKIFADAYGKDQDFFAFYRSMQAYEFGLQKEGTRMLLSPDSDFFRYFQNPAGTMAPAPTPPQR